MTKDEFIRWETVSRDMIDVKRIYVDIAGDLVTGVLLSQVVFWHLPDKNGNSKLRVFKDSYYWLAKKREDWWDECRISPKQFDRSCEILEAKGILVSAVYGFAGAPIKHIRLNFDNLIKEITAYSPKGKLTKGEDVLNSDILPKGEDGYSPKVNMDIPQRSISNTETTTEITTETTVDIKNPSKLTLYRNGAESTKENKIEDAAYSLFLDWRDMVEKPHIQWDIKGWRAKRIIKWLKNGFTFDDLRLAVRGMLTDDFLQKSQLDDIDWLCRDESSRIERYKGLAIKRGIKPDDAIRKSNGYRKTSSKTKKDFASERI